MDSPSISLIHPSRSRPKEAFAAYQLWKARRTTFNLEIEYLLMLDKSDPFVYDYVNLFLNDNKTCDCFHDRVFIHTADWMPEKVNYGARKAKGDIFIVMADDCECPYGWDEDLMQEIEGKEDFALHCNDGIQKNLITMQVLDRKYYERDGFIFNEDYKHMYADTEFTAKAYMRDRIIKSDLLFRHNHPIRPANFDTIYKRGYSTMEKGREIYRKRLFENFGLKSNEILKPIPAYLSRL